MITLARLLLVGCFLVLMAGCDRNAESGLSSVRQELNPPTEAYVNARTCSEADATCQSLVDLYDRKPGFKESLRSALAAAEVSVPEWLPVALTSKLIRQDRGGESLVIGRACEPRNCAQFLYVAQNEATDRLYGFYRTNEQIDWFGQPDDAEKALLCNTEQFCHLEPRLSEIRPQLNKLGFPEMTQLTEFSNCTEFKGGLSSRDGFVCREQYLAQCAYASGSCSVSSEFVGDQLAQIAFKYKYRQIRYDELKKVLDKTYGKATEQIIRPDAPNNSTAWVSTWTNGNVRIVLRRVKGSAYDDVWISLSDGGYVLFNSAER